MGEPTERNARTLLTRRDLLRGIAVTAATLSINQVLAACGAAPTPAATSQPAQPTSSVPVSAPTVISTTPAQPQPTTATAPKMGGALRYGLYRDATTQDPHLSGGSTHPLMPGNVFDTLVEYDVKGNIVGSLAESYERPDDTTYVFKLRQGVKFANGAAFTAQDVLATIGRIREPKTAAANAGALNNIDTLEAPDAMTVRMKLKTPDALFLNTLANSSSWILSAADVGKAYKAPTDWNGTGPFILGSWEPERQMTLKRNPNYWKKGLPYLDQIVMTVINDDNARMDALRSRSVDMTEYVPAVSFATLEGEQFQIFKRYDLNSFVRVNVNKPPLDNKKVRQALAMVVDRQAVNDLAFNGLGRTMIGGAPLQPPTSPYYVKELEGTYNKNWDKAKALLKEAGYNSPADLPALEYKTTSGAVSGQPAKVVLQQLQEFGLKVTLTMIDVPTLTQNRLNGNYQLHHDGGGMDVPDPDYLRTIFHSKLGKTYATGVGFKIDRLDQLLEEGAKTLDVAKRKTIYAEAEKILVDEVPYIWITWRVQAEALDPKIVKGYEQLPDALASYNIGRMEYLWLNR